MGARCLARMSPGMLADFYARSLARQASAQTPAVRFLAAIRAAAARSEIRLRRRLTWHA